MGKITIVEITLPSTGLKRPEAGLSTEPGSGRGGGGGGGGGGGRARYRRATI